MQLLLKLAAAAMGAAVAYVLATRHAWAIATPEGVALITFGATLSGLVALRFDPASAAGSEGGGGAPRRWSRGARLFKAMMISMLLIIAVSVLYGQRHGIAQSARYILGIEDRSRAIVVSSGEIVLKRDYGGHFIASVEIGAHRLRMLVDTGSTDIALPYEQAERIGIDVATLDFGQIVSTANGSAKVALTTIASVKLGPIELRDVSATIAEPGRLSSPLLGMSFLNELAEVTFSGDELRLRR